MSEFRFYYPIEVRYGDLDPQGHVNNAKFFTYIEQARIAYVINLGLWDGGSFFDIGFILADAHITFKSPITFGKKVQVGVRTTRLGNKSLTMEYWLGDLEENFVYALGSTVLVTYDYGSQSTIPIPPQWCATIKEFELLENV